MYKDNFRVRAREAKKSKPTLTEKGTVLCYTFSANFSTMAGTTPALFLVGVLQ